MYYVNHVQLDLASLSPHTPKELQYRGQGEIENMIKNKWQELKDKYGNEPITFVCPAIKSGVGMGNMGGAFNRTVIIQTQTGTKVVTWCESAIEVSKGIYEYRPIKYRHTPERKQITLDLTKDIEEILYLTLFDPYRKMTYTYPAKDDAGNPHPMSGRSVPKVYLLDRNEEAKNYLTETSKSADMKFYLTSERSPIIRNRDMINILASAWGVVRPENKSDALVRMELMQAIEGFEKQHSSDWGYEGFCARVDALVNHGEDPSTETMALISQAIDRSILKYAVQRLSWFLLNESGAEIKKLCSVPSLEAERPKEVLCRHLLADTEDLSLVQGSVEVKPLYQKNIPKVYIPENPTEKWFREEMPFPKMKTACTIINFPHLGKTKNQLADVLVDHFITKKKWIPEENLLDKP